MTATITVLVHSMYDACLCSIGICSGRLMIQSPRLPIIHVPPSSQMYSIFCSDIIDTYSQGPKLHLPRHQYNYKIECWQSEFHAQLTAGN